MTAEMIRQVVPLGIVGLAIIAVLLIALNPGSKTNLSLAVGAMVVVGALAVFDRMIPKKELEPNPGLPALENKANISATMLWVDTGTKADWGGRDVAYTVGLTPKYKVKDTALCDENHIGSIATCWENRPNGYPAGVNATDVAGAPAQWCTYKDSSIGLLTPPDGAAPRGRVFMCARSIPRS
jgi:hypothetical protein